MDQYVVLASHGQLFAVEIQSVVRVIEAKPFVKLPEVPDFILGIYEYKKTMVPVIDIRKQLFKENTEQSENTKVILISWREHLLGVYVEDILGITHLDEADFSADFVKKTMEKQYIAKFLTYENQLVAVLALDELFQLKETSQLLEQLERSGEQTINYADSK